MNDIANYQAQLPDTLEDLTKFVLVGKAQLSAYMSRLRTVNKLSVAQEIRNQTLQETQELANALIAAEQRIGELLLNLPTAQGRRTDISTSGHTNPEVETKAEAVTRMGYGEREAKDYQQMAQNPEAVQIAIQKAIDNGDVVSRNQVMKEIRSAKEELKRQLAEKDKRISELENQGRVEVFPADYLQLQKDLKDAKRQASAYRQDLKNEQKRFNEKARENVRLRDEVEDLKRQTISEQNMADLNGSALTFAMECRGFLQTMGGFTFVAEHLAELNEKERKGYIVAAKAMRDWAEILLSTIEKNEEELYGSY